MNNICCQINGIECNVCNKKKCIEHEGPFIRCRVCKEWICPWCLDHTEDICFRCVPSGIHRWNAKTLRWDT